jgi:hypothetical protein
MLLATLCGTRRPIPVPTSGFFLLPNDRQVKLMSKSRMGCFFCLGVVAALLLSPLAMLHAQDLAPRAYVITPLHANAVTLTSSFYDGSIDFNGALPVSDAKGTYDIPIISVYHSFGILAHSANILAALPYGIGTFQGTAAGVPRNLYRSGLVDSTYRLSVNLMGGPAMPPPEFSKWQQKVLLGVSLKAIAPTGQYDPTKLVNWGTNRWSFKPEFGYSQRFGGKWIFDGYAGVWFFTANRQFYPGTSVQTQSPIGALEGHLSYDFKPRFWVSLDGNFWYGGTTSVSGLENSLTTATNSRVGATAAIPITGHQALKFGYSIGTYIRYGGNYQNVSVAWQYSWLGRPN